MLVTELVLLIASVLTVAVLGAAEFEALGPAAGTAAASWQASLRLVEAGSLFAWCQSARSSCRWNPSRRSHRLGDCLHNLDKRG